MSARPWVRVARTSRNPALTSPGRQFSFAACAYGGFQHKLCYTEPTDDVQEFLAEVAPSAHIQAQIFTCPEVGRMRDRMRFGELIA